MTDYSTEEFGLAVPGGEGPPGQEVPAVPETIDPEVLRESILAEAREEARQKVEEAYERGLELGRETGEAQFRAEIAESAKALATAADAMRTAREEFLEGMEPQVLELAILVAKRVLDREVRTDPNLVNATVRRALGILADRQKLVVRVNPADLDALNAHKLSLLHDFSGIVSLEVVPDAAVDAGGCVVVSETMEVDARIETLLSEVLDTLED